jgi:hypothetical protein
MPWPRCRALIAADLPDDVTPIRLEGVLTLHPTYSHWAGTVCDQRVS